jgi:ankyrin repeat protein
MRDRGQFGSSGCKMEESWSIKLDKAAADGDAHMVQTLCMAGVGAIHRQEALFTAARGGHLEVVRVLCMHGTEVNRRCHGYTPLHIAAAVGQHDVVALLCEHGADTNLSDCDGLTPLHSVAMSTVIGCGHEQSLQLMCAHTDNINSKDKLGRTALFMAAQTSTVRGVGVLLAMGADISIADDEGLTPAHMALYPGIVDLLARHGADLEREDQYGRTPIHHAALLGRAVVISAMCKQGVQIECIQPSLVTTLLERVRRERRHPSMDRDSSPNKQCHAVVLLMAAGCKPTQADLYVMNMPALRAEFRKAREFAAAMFTSGPTSLQYLCTLSVRRVTRKPLPMNVARLKLPQLLQRYILLTDAESESESESECDE